MFKSQISTVAKGAAGRVDGNEISLLNCQYLILPLVCRPGTDIQHAPQALTLKSQAFRKGELSTVTQSPRRSGPSSKPQGAHSLTNVTCPAAEAQKKSASQE